MRVGFFSNVGVYKGGGGAPRSLIEIIDGLKSFNVKPFVVCQQEGDLAEILRKRNIPIAIIPYVWWVAPGKRDLRNSWSRLRVNLQAVPAVIRQFKKWDIDIVYSNAAVIPIGAFTAKIMRKPHVWHLREAMHLQGNSNYDFGWKFFQFWLKQADAQITNSNAIKENLLKGLCQDNAVTVYNGVVSENDFETKLVKPMKQGNEYIFSIVSRLDPNKRQDFALRAFAQVISEYPNVKLVLAGSGPEDYVKKCIALSHELKIQNNVAFLGEVQNPFDVHLSSDAAITCSRHEAMGRCTAEAMAAGLPVIGFDEMGTSELISHEKTGLLFKGGVDELAACMKRFLENQEWARRMGQAGRLVAKEQFTQETCTKKIYEILIKISKKS